MGDVLTLQFPDSIYALSSGAVPAGVAVLRLSGGAVRDALQTLAGCIPKPREASLRTIASPTIGPIDRGLILFFPAPASFTGEDCAELHLHGGKAVVAAAMAALQEIPGFRQADAGEFTRRAFLNGKVDLTSAEALADLVSAETEAQRRLALDNASGKQQLLYSSWRKRLLHARAMIEAELDFSDEADVAGSMADLVWPDLTALEMELGGHLAGNRAAMIVRDGFRVVVTGEPNAGKSSLVNALARRDVAIVTEIPGTTRDTIEAILDLGGNKVILTDTAGIRESDDMIEMMGVGRAREAVKSADLVLRLVAPGTAQQLGPTTDGVESRIVATKQDLDQPYHHRADHYISTVSGAGLGGLLEDVANTAARATNRSGVLPTRMRHVRLIEDGLAHLAAALQMRGEATELHAEELRLAERALSRVIGSTDVEDVLGEVFARFCIGK